MTALFIKLFALALALGQVATQPDAVRTHFDPVRDRGEVVRILRDGCTHMRKSFGIEDFNLDDLVETAMEDTQASQGAAAAFHGIDFKQLHDAYLAYCTDRTTSHEVVDLGAVIAFYNAAAASLPDETSLADLRLPERTRILDGQGKPFAELYQPDNRRIVVPLEQIPDHVQKAFVAAEDRRFADHHGIDERGLIRAFIENLAQHGRVQGGSTITQQVAKNLLVGADVTYERKIRELIVSSRMERTLTKARILELYLNSIYLGRGAWGVEMAAQSYFDKSVADLSLAEAAFLAGLAKGPNFFAPDRNPRRGRERMAYVLERMKEDKIVTPAQADAALTRPLRFIPGARHRRDSGFYPVDEVSREAARLAGIPSLTSAARDVRTSIDAGLQKAVEAALQEGLARYEAGSARAPRVAKAEAGLTDAIARIETGGTPASGFPAWRSALQTFAPPLYDVHWTPAVVVKRQASDASIVVGIGDGRLLPLDLGGVSGADLKRDDVIYVWIADRRGKLPARAELRQRPTVQGGAVVLENKTGRVLATVGGFSYPLSQISRVTQTRRQPGSAFKPVVYLAALRAGLQPNTLIPDRPITLPPIDAGMRAAQVGYWTPRNYDGAGGGTMTLRQALEASRNVVTARLLQGGIARNPHDSLRAVCALAREADLYPSCVDYYPFVLGAQPVRMIDLAAFYASIANEGAGVTPHVIDAILRNGETVYRYEEATAETSAFDRSAAYQLKTLLQGVVARGTARSMHALAPYVAGKTGTSNDENDAWFVGFTNDITIAVWIGYDNAGGRRLTLGEGNTGGKVAVPVFQAIVEAAWASGLPKAPLAAPTPEAMGSLVQLPIAPASGARLKGGAAGGFMETFRLDAEGVLHDTRAAMTTKKDDESWRQHSPGAGVARAEQDEAESREAARRPPPERTAARAPERAPAAAPPPEPVFAPRPVDVMTPRWLEEERARSMPPKIDPDYLWTRRRMN